MISSGLAKASKQDTVVAKTILERYDAYCERQQGQEFLWYSISFITLIGSIMPISLILMFSTPWFYPFVFVAMILFFGNMLAVIGRMSMKVIISFYLFTVAVNVLVPALAYLLMYS